MTNKKCLVIATLLIALGTIVFTFSACSGADLSGIILHNYTTEEFKITEDFDSVVIDVTTADINLVASEDNACRLVVYSHKKIKYAPTVSESKLTVTLNDEREWYDHIAIITEAPKITLYLPKAQYDTLVIDGTTGDVDVPMGFTFGTVDISLTTGDINLFSDVTGMIKTKATTGDITFKNISAASIDLELTTGDVALENIVCGGNISVDVSTGEVHLNDVTCHNLTGNGTTGNMSLVNVIASGKITFVINTGDVIFERSDAAELEITTSTGDVTGTLLTPKIFITSTSTGRIDVPETTEGGVCKITTSTGKIIIDIAE